MDYKSARGFTLIEIMIAMAIIGIISAIAIPSFSYYMKSQRLSGACRQLYSDLMGARMQAVSQNTNIIVELTDATNYRIVRDQNKNKLVDSGEPFVNRSILPDYFDVTIAVTSASAYPVFFPNGTGISTAFSVTSTSLGKTKAVAISNAGRVKIN